MRQPKMMFPEQQAMMPMQFSYPPEVPMFLSIASEWTLYVGNIQLDIPENYLFQLFTPFGRLVSLKLMKNIYTGESRGFAFVTYANREQAEAAIKALNGYKLSTKELRVMYKKNIRDLNEKANLIIKNLGQAVTLRQIQNECQKFGRVVSCVVIKNENGPADSVGYGYVQFETEQEALNFMEGFNGKVLCDKPVVVERFIPSKQRAKSENKNIYLKNFPKNWNQQRIEEFIRANLSKLGEISSMGVKLDQTHKLFYAFVAYEKAEAAKEAIEKWNNARGLDEAADEPLYVGPAMSKAARMKMLMRDRNQFKNDTNIYIRSLKDNVTKEKLRAAFEKYGPITSVAIKEWDPPQKDAGSPRLQFGFVNFTRPEDAKNLYVSYRNDPEILSLVQIPETQKGNYNFIFYAQVRKLRDQYLRTSKNQQLQNQMYANYFKQPSAGYHGRRPNQRPPNFGQGLQAPMIPVQNIKPPNVMNFNTPPTPQTPPNLPEPPQPALIRKLDRAGLTMTDMVGLIRANEADFRALPREQQKKILGNTMYKRVSEVTQDADLLPKVTGMLIDQDVLSLEEILDIISDNQVLRERVQEAIEIIRNPEES